jgi:UDP-GlcNAc:undecaprenyl-phosphate GlcNAc-1-phosphate transferase
MSYIARIVLTFLISSTAALFLLSRLASIATRVGLLDRPGVRKVHAEPKPLVGGVGMVMGLSIACLLFVPLANLRGFYMGMVILVSAGFLDDCKELGHKVKFLAQVAAALFMVYYSDTVLLTFGDLLSLGDINFGELAVPMTVFATIGVINAINMIDGLDGLAGGISLVAFATFTAFAYLNGQTQLVVLGIAFCGVLIGFLKYNFYPAALFMGDAGSLSLGFALAFFSIAVTQGEGLVVPPAAPLLVLAVPITDTLILMTRRMLRRRSPFHADKHHLHHILLKFGFGQWSVATFMILLTALFCSVAFAGTVLKIPEHYLFMVFLAYFGICFVGSLNIKRIYRAWLQYRGLAGKRVTAHSNR